MNYDQAVEQIRLQNAPILNEFEDWLTASGVSPKTIKSHIDNIEFFAQYLFYYEPLKKLDQATEDDVYTFLSDWFPRKAMWASASSTKFNMASFRKFFKFLHESHRIDKKIQADVLSTLKEFKDEFLDAVAFDEHEKWKHSTLAYFGNGEILLTLRSSKMAKNNPYYSSRDEDNDELWDQKYEEWKNRVWNVWLSENLVFPFELKRMEDLNSNPFFDNDDETFSFRHTMKVLTIEDEDADYSILVKVREGRQSEVVPLCDVEVTSRQDQNFWPVREYVVWFANRDK